VGKREAGREHVILLEAGIEMEQVEERAEHEAGADEQNAGEAHLCDDERAAQAVLTTACRAGSGILLQSLFGISARGLYCGSKAEECAGQDAHGEGEYENGGVHVNFLRTGKVSGKQRNQQAHAAECQCEAEAAAR